MLVRREGPGDVETVQSIVASAFARPNASGDVPVEVRLLEELRRDDGWLPALSLVAAESADAKVSEQKIIGQVVCTRGTVDGQPALGLGPLAVHPDRQGRGVGSALMHAVLGAADALNEPLVGLLGEPEYYARFGFRPSSEYGITAPDVRWGHYFQVRVLSAYRPLEGTFAYANPFDRL